MIIRSATGEDAGAIRSVHLQAFPTAAEADLVECLVADGDAVASIVGEIGEIVAHLLLSRMAVSADGRPLSALAVAPVAVVPERQGQGIGSALIEAAIREARARGEHMLFVVGDPDYYGRFGFGADTAMPFESPYAGPHFQALSLVDGAPPAGGVAEYPEAFGALD